MRPEMLGRPSNATGAFQPPGPQRAPHLPIEHSCVSLEKVSSSKIEYVPFEYVNFIYFFDMTNVQYGFKVLYVVNSSSELARSSVLSQAVLDESPLRTELGDKVHHLEWTYHILKYDFVIDLPTGKM